MARRSRHFVQPQDLCTTLLWALGVSESTSAFPGQDLRRIASGEEEARDRMCATFGDQYAIRTPAWFMRESATEGVTLFFKPDDFWEANEVARRCDQVVQLLQQAHTDLIGAVNAGSLDQLPQLPEVLVHGLD